MIDAMVVLQSYVTNNERTWKFPSISLPPKPPVEVIRLIEVSTLLVQQQLTLPLPEAVAKVACGGTSSKMDQNGSKHVFGAETNTFLSDCGA